MFRTPHIRAFATAFGLVATVALCPAAEPTAEEMQATIAELRAQNATLQRSLVQANKAEKEATEQLAQVRLRLAALGKNLLDGGNDRLVQAASDLELSRERTTALETAATKVIAAVADYLRQAVVSDPDSRARLETSLRELDLILGFRDKPRPEVVTGALQQAKIVSIDQESGLVVLNLGEQQGAKVGMTFDLFRAQSRYGKAVLGRCPQGRQRSLRRTRSRSECPNLRRHRRPQNRIAPSHPSPSADHGSQKHHQIRSPLAPKSA